MEGNIKVKVQSNGMTAIHQGDYAETIYPLKMRGFIRGLGLAKRKATQLNPGKILIYELRYQPGKLYTEALLEVLSKFIIEEINRTLKNKCMVCYDLPV